MPVKFFFILLTGFLLFQSKVNAQCTAPTNSVIQPTSCTSPNGQITVSAPTPTANYQFSINNGATFQVSNIFTGLAAGSYNVRTKENTTGCISSITVATLTAPVVTTPTATIVANSNCTGTPNGSITVTAPTPLAGFSFSKDNGTTFQSGNVFSNLAAGSYSIVAKSNATGCTSAVFTATVTNSFAVVSAPVSTNVNPASCTVPNGSITITAPAPTANFTFSINNGVTFQSGTGFTNLAAGTYNVVAKSNATGCTSAATVVTLANPVVTTPTATITANSNCSGTPNVSGPGSVYFTWSAQCTGGCGGPTPTWIIIGIQNQVIPGSTGAGPFTVYAGGAITFSGTITAASTQAQAGANNGDGFNANITPSPTYPDIALGASNNQSTFGYTSGVVPVRLVSFTAKKQGAIALLNWATSMELNSSRFDVERSADGHVFIKAGTIQASGNSNAITNYSFTDDNPFKGTNYYRLKLIDIDGTYEYSDVKKLEFSTGVEAVVYPNPVTNTLYIKNLHGNNVMELINTDGKIIKTLNVASSTKDIDMSMLTKGVYLLKITEGNSQSIVIKVIKQ